MKKNITLLIFLSIFTFAWANAPQSLNYTFTSDMEGWITANNSTSEINNGHIECQLGLNGTKYRADLKYNDSNQAANNVTLDPTKDVYIAIKFIGDKPKDGAFKFEMQRDDNGTTTWFNSKWNGGADGKITTLANNNIYYFDLSKDDTYTALASVDLRRLNFVLADVTQEPYEYVVDWIATFETLEDLEAYKNFNDDGDDDQDEGSYSPNPEQVKSLNYTFTTELSNWITDNNSNYSLNNSGHLVCEMGLNGTKYRGDLKYNDANNTANNLTLNPAEDLYLAVKFIGDKPGDGAFKLEMQRDDGGTLSWFNTQWNYGADGSISTTSNNKIYYFNLSKDNGYTALTSVDIRKMNIIIADVTQEPYKYTVDWIATFSSLEDLETYKDFKDDGIDDADETTVDPATLDGYFYYNFAGGTDSWIASTTEKVFRNNNKLILKHSDSDRLQTRRNATTINATNFPYVAVKIDALPEGFDVANFKIQTNCNAISVYDSWYSVTETKGSIYVFDMTVAVNKNTAESQNAIMDTNEADIWIDFGTVTAGAIAQIGWIKTFQTLDEITAEDAEPLTVETNPDAGQVTFEFDNDAASNTSWAWRTVHYADGENGCKVSAADGQLAIEAIVQIGARTRELHSLNTANYPYFAVKVNDMGDAGHFELFLESITKGNFKKSNLDEIVTKVGENIYVFDLSGYSMISTATDMSIRMDFYLGTSGTTACPTGTVKVDWIRSYKTLEEIEDDEEVPSILGQQEENNISVWPQNDNVVIQGIESGSKVNLYNITGTMLTSVIADSEMLIIPLQQKGIFIIEVIGNQSTVVKILK